MNYLATQLRNTDSEDVDDMISGIETSFRVKVETDELAKINSIAELCELICSKISLDRTDSCTSQQAFYKFRKAYLASQNSGIPIQTNSLLVDLFPENTRKQDLNKIETELGFKLHVLEPPNWLIFSLLFLLMISIGFLFYDAIIGIMGVLLAILGFVLAAKYADQFTLKTVNELIHHMVHHNYRMLRNSNTYNAREVEGIVIGFFVDELGYDKSKFDSKSKFTESK